MPDPRYTFPKSHHMCKPAEFDVVYFARCAKRIGPLRIHGRPNELGHHRLGLSVGRRVGGAVKRVRLKRKLREAYRLLRHEFPGAYDFVVVAYAHDPLELEDYQRMLTTAAKRVNNHWLKRDDDYVEPE